MAKIAAILITITLFLSSGCSTTPFALTPEITPLDNKRIGENFGRVEGRNSAFSVLGLFMIGNPDIDKAIDEALSVKGGDTLINVRCYEVYRYFIFFSTSTVVVQGDAVKISDSAAVRGGGRR